MKLDELATFAALALLFVLMAYAIITTAASSDMKQSISSPPVDTRPVIQDCDLPTWEEVRGLCASTPAGRSPHARGDSTKEDSN